MLISQYFLAIIALLGLILNIVTLYITGYQLRFFGMDLTLVGIVAIFDTLISAVDIIRILALEMNWLSCLKVNLNWCIFDSTTMLVSSQTTIETVAILGVLRYLAICLNKLYPKFVWILLVGASFSISLIFSLYNSLYQNSYNWSNSGLFCLPDTNENAPNLKYFFGFFITMIFRISVSLIVISFCYYKILKAYRKILEERVNSVELRENNNSEPVSTTQSTVTHVSFAHLRKQIQQEHKIISIQLLGIALLYIFCCTPIQFIHLFKLLTGLYPSPNVVIISEILYSTNIIINPLFVLISHEPSRRELIILISKLFHLKSKPEPFENFPYDY